jgi:hypothetical protein
MMPLAEGPLNREQAKEWDAVQKLRTFVDRNHPAFFGAQKSIFNQLFPESITQEGPHKSLFRLESISQHPEVEYTKGEKEVVQNLLAKFGWEKSDGKTRKGQYDMPHLYIAYNDNPHGITTHLNKMEFMRRQDAIGMADMTLQSSEAGIYKMTRGQHVRHMASFVFRDILRMAIKTPEELTARIAEDFKRYGYTPEQTKKLLSAKNNATIAQSALDAQYNPSIEQLRALDMGLEYAKYLAIFAYIHDERTPAWGDVIMKGKARFPGQMDIRYSEDQKLRDDIEMMIGLKRATGSDTGLPQVFDRFNLDRKFFAKLVKSLSSEGDSCLGGILMKCKRKADFAENNPELAEKLKAIGATYIKKDGSVALGAVFDEDQTSGTIANLYDLAKQVLPGGLHYIPKIENTKHLDRTKLPYGTFYDRLSILAFAVATGQSKTDLLRFCKKNKIDPARLYIARDEFHIGANFELRGIDELGGEILPVGIDPGAIKRLMYAFATLTYFHYQSDARSGVERLIQDVITTVHEAQYRQSVLHPETHIGAPDNTQILSYFLNSTDEGAAITLEESFPVLPFIKNKFLPKTRRLTEDEVAGQVDSILSRGNHYLISHADMFPVDKKSGTLTVNDRREVAGYMEIIGRDRLTGEAKEDSLPRQLERVEAEIQSHQFFHIIELTDEDISILEEKIHNTKPTAIRELVKKALRYWTLNLPVGQAEYGDAFLKERFRLEHEEPGIPLWQQNDSDLNISHLMRAQANIYAASSR